MKLISILLSGGKRAVRSALCLLRGPKRIWANGTVIRVRRAAVVSTLLIKCRVAADVTQGSSRWDELHSRARCVNYWCACACMTDVHNSFELNKNNNYLTNSVLNIMYTSLWLKSMPVSLINHSFQSVVFTGQASYWPLSLSLSLPLSHLIDWSLCNALLFKMLLPCNRHKAIS